MLIDYNFRKSAYFLSRATNEFEHSVPIAYSFDRLAKLCSALGMYPPAAAINIQPGRCPSQFTAICVYIFTTWVTFLGYAAVHLLYSPQFERIRPYLVNKTANFVIGLAHVVALFYVTYGPACVSYLYYHRGFLRKFVLYKCAILTIPKLHQYQVTIGLFTAGCIICFIAEPLSILFVIEEDFVQTKVWSNLSEAQFRLIKLGLSYFMALSITILNIVELLMPMITCFLSQAMENYLRITFDKQTKRLVEIDPRNHKPNACLIKLHASTNLMEDYQIETFCNDWPQMEESQPFSDKSCNILMDYQKDEQLHPEPATYTHFSKSQSKKDPRRSSGPDCLIIGRRLFLLRNLLKSLKDLRDIRRSYESVFGKFHVITICVNGLLLSEWVVLGLIRSQAILLETNIDTAQGDIYKVAMNQIAWRTTLSIVAFIAGNIVLFMRLDELPSRIKKMNCRLFKINLDLVNLGQGSFHRSKQDQSNMISRELEESWLLYDHVMRIGKQANFRLMGNTYYDKTCLLFVFSNAASFILLYLQVLDIYDNGKL